MRAMTRRCVLELGRRFGGCVVGGDGKRYLVNEARWVRPGGETSDVFVALSQQADQRGGERTWRMVIEPGVLGGLVESLAAAREAVLADSGGFVPQTYLGKGGKGA